MSRETHIVGFRVGRETYGVPITSLHEIVRVPEITAVPDAPDYLEGVINLRGKIVSVVDLRKRFGQPCHRTRPAQPHSGRGTPGPARGHDCGFGVGGSENSGKRNRSRARHDAGRRIGLCDRPRQVPGTADHSAGYRQGIGGARSSAGRRKRRETEAEKTRHGREGRRPQESSRHRTHMNTSETPALTEAELKLLQTLVYQECGMHFDERRTPVPAGPFAAPVEGVPTRFVLQLLSPAHQPAGKTRTVAACSKTSRSTRPASSATRRSWTCFSGM
jgi:hypothetical protein